MSNSPPLLTGNPSSSSTSRLDWLLSHPKFTALLSCVSLALAFTPKFSVIASWILLIIAGVFGVVLLGSTSLLRGKRVRVVLVSLLIVAILTLFGKWLAGAKTAESPESDDVIAQMSKDLAAIKGILSQDKTPVPAPPPVVSRNVRPKPKKPQVEIGTSAPSVPQSNAQQRLEQSEAKTRTLAEILGELETKRLEREARDPPESPCHGDNLKACGDKALLQWGAPLIDRLTKMYDHLGVELTVARRLGSEQYLKVLESIEDDIATQYRRCCAVDAVKYHQELCSRLGGGLQDQNFYDWSARLLQANKPKDWKTAKEGAQYRVMQIKNDLKTKTRELEYKIQKRRLDD